MHINYARLQAILDAPHSFYGSGDAPVRNDARLNPGTGDFLGAQFSPQMRVLDLGCGNGNTLLEHSRRFQYGLGVDNDPAHIELAQIAAQSQAINNVEFRLFDMKQEGDLLEPESFDFVFSQRGPLDDSEADIQAALRVLKADGLLFCEMIGELHHQEVREFFDNAPQNKPAIRTGTELRDALARNGLSIRLVSDIISKRYYPDIYAWLQFQSAIWGWLGMPMPAADDPRFEAFAAHYTTPSGEIVTTHHVVWVAGVK